MFGEHKCRSYHQVCSKSNHDDREDCDGCDSFHPISPRRQLVHGYCVRGRSLRERASFRGAKSHAFADRLASKCFTAFPCPHHPPYDAISQASGLQGLSGDFQRLGSAQNKKRRPEGRPVELVDAMGLDELSSPTVGEHPKQANGGEGKRRRLWYRHGSKPHAQAHVHAAT
jgi:hypothetical protein